MSALAIINGSISGRASQTWAAVKPHLEDCRDAYTLVTLADHSCESAVAACERASAILLLSGVYWESWGSPMQAFIEYVTLRGLELAPTFWMKPVGAIVRMHSAGGTGVLARLLWTFNQLGCVINPCTSAALSHIGQEAASRGEKDVWCSDDIPIAIRNLLGTPGTPERWDIVKGVPG